MRVRVSFEPWSGISLWADDDAARDRWSSAVAELDLALPQELCERAQALRERFDATFDPDDPGMPSRMTEEERQAFETDAQAWSEAVRAWLAPQGIDVVTYCETLAREPNWDETLLGYVVVCFQDERACEAATGLPRPEYRRGPVVSWRAQNIAWKDPGAWASGAWVKTLAALPGVLAVWWQEAEEGTNPGIEGDVEDLAHECLLSGNATGWINFLSALQVQRLVLPESRVGHPWTPSEKHRLDDGKGSPAEWSAFFEAAARMLAGKPAPRSYLREETDRRRYTWNARTWPLTWGAAADGLGLRRIDFQTWAQQA